MGVGEAREIERCGKAGQDEQIGADQRATLEVEEGEGWEGSGQGGLR